MGINIVNYQGRTLIDLMQDTVEIRTLGKGVTAHDRHGDIITGTANTQEVPIEYDYNIGYITNGSWVYENPTRTYTDFYRVKSGHRYYISLGATVGSRFRAMFTTTDVRTVTSGSVAGTNIINLNNPAAYRNTLFTPTSDGYIIIAKDNVGVSGLKTWVYDTTEWT